jgi:hypothetical protein
MEGVLTLLIGLFTGLGATIIPKLIDGGQKKADFKRDLEKTYFLEKLKAGTEAYAQFNMSIGALHHAQILLKTVRDPQFKDEDESIKKLTQKNLQEVAIKGAAKSEELATTAALSYGLFFDTPNDDEYLRISEEIHLDQSRFDKLANEYYKAEAQYYDENSPDYFKSQAKADYDARLADFIAAMDLRIRKYEAFSNIIKLKMKDLNEYYKKYDKV